MTFVLTGCVRGGQRLQSASKPVRCWPWWSTAAASHASGTSLAAIRWCAHKQFSCGHSAPRMDCSTPGADSNTSTKRSTSTKHLAAVPIASSPGAMVPLPEYRQAYAARRNPPFLKTGETTSAASSPLIHRLTGGRSQAKTAVFCGVRCGRRVSWPRVARGFSHGTSPSRKRRCPIRRFRSSPTGRFMRKRPRQTEASWSAGAATGFTPWYATPYANNQCDDLFTNGFGG